MSVGTGIQITVVQTTVGLLCRSARLMLVSSRKLKVKKYRLSPHDIKPVFRLRDRGPGYHYQGKLSGPGYEWLRLTVPIIRELAEHETRRRYECGD